MFSKNKIYKPFNFKILCLIQFCFAGGFYSLKSFLLLYFINQYSLKTPQAIGLFAAFMAISYGTSILGGWLTDKYLNIKKAIFLGMILQILGISLFIYSSLKFCYFALALMSLGTGFYKPSLLNAIGLTCPDHKNFTKDQAYSTFYLFMNFGSFLVPLLSSLLIGINPAYKYLYSSLLILSLFLVGLYIFIRFEDDLPQTTPSSHSQFSTHFAFPILLCVPLLGFLTFLFMHQKSLDHLMSIIAVGSLLYFIHIYYECNPEERQNFRKISVYILIFTIFFSLYEQTGSSFLLFFEQAVDRSFLGWTIPSSLLIPWGAMSILIAGPFVIFFSQKIQSRYSSFKGFTKSSLGFVFISLSFFSLIFSCKLGNSLISPLWIVSALFLQAIGEFLIVPVGSANISKLSPIRYRNLTMSFWLMAIAYGHYFAGLLARFSLHFSDMTSSLTQDSYFYFFFKLGTFTFFISFILFFSQKVKWHKFYKLKKTL